MRPATVAAAELALLALAASLTLAALHLLRTEASDGVGDTASHSHPNTRRG